MKRKTSLRPKKEDFYFVSDREGGEERRRIKGGFFFGGEARKHLGGGVGWGRRDIDPSWICTVHLC